jgi:hypothetical protein
MPQEPEYEFKKYDYVKTRHFKDYQWNMDVIGRITSILTDDILHVYNPRFDGMIYEIRVEDFIIYRQGSELEPYEPTALEILIFGLG